MTGAVTVDREAGPAGEIDDTIFIHRFQPLHDIDVSVHADYVYVSQVLNEFLAEQHVLKFCDPDIVASAMKAVGLKDVTVLHSSSVSPFIVGKAV